MLEVVAASLDISYYVLCVNSSVTFMCIWAYVYVQPATLIETHLNMFVKLGKKKKNLKILLLSESFIKA